MDITWITTCDYLLGACADGIIVGGMGQNIETFFTKRLKDTVERNESIGSSICDVGMVLSELSNTPYNALFKCFACNQKARQEAYQTVLRYKRPYFTPSVRAVIAQIAALTEQEFDQDNEELHGALLASFSGTNQIGDQEPFTNLSSIEILKEVETYLRAQL